MLGRDTGLLGHPDHLVERQFLPLGPTLTDEQGRVPTITFPNPLTILTSLFPHPTDSTSTLPSTSAISSASLNSTSSLSTTSSVSNTTSSTSSSTSSSFSPTVIPTSTDVPVTTVVQTLQAPSPTSHKSSSNSFLSNKPLAGTVFGIVGLLIFILLITAVTYGLRRARKNRLEAISFDPDVTSDTAGHLIDSGHNAERERSQGTSTTGHGYDVGSYENSIYPDYGQMQQYPVVPPLPQASAYARQQAYYNTPPQPQMWAQQPMYGVPPSLVPGYDTRPDAVYHSQVAGTAVGQYNQQAYNAMGMPVGPVVQRNDTLPPNAPRPSVAMGHGQGQGQGPLSQSRPADTSQSPPPPPASSVSPIPPSKQPAGGGNVAFRSREQDPKKLPSVPASEGSRDSIEADAQFWSRTLKIANQ